VFIRRLNAEYMALQQHRETLLKRLDDSAASQHYLETVVETAEEFHEIREIIARYMTLVSTHHVRLILHGDSEKFPLCLCLLTNLHRLCLMLKQLLAA